MSDLSQSSSTNSKHFVWDIATLALPIIGLAPMLVLYAMEIWSKPATALMPLCWLALAMLAYYERKSMSQTRWRVLLSYFFLAIAAAVGVASIVFFSPWAANIALAFVFVGWALVRIGPASFPRILALSLLILVCSTLPFGFEAKVTGWTNSLVVRSCSAVLDVFNVYHLYHSPYLALRDHHFEIAELLGNVFSVQSMVAIALVVSVVWRRPFITTSLTVLSALVWTVLGKIFYLFITAVFSSNGINILEFFWGSLILWGLFFLFFLILLASDAFWNAMLSPIQAGDEGVYRSATADFFNRFVVWPGKMEFQARAGRTAKPARMAPSLNAQPIVGIAFGLLMALLCVPAGLAIVKNDLLLNRANYLSIPDERIPDAKSLPEDFIPKQRQRQFRVLASSGMSGGTAKTLLWNYGGSGVDTLFLLRYPVRGWMPEESSSFQGWKPVESKLASDGSNWPWSESIFQGESGSSGLLLTSQLHTKGDPYVPTEEELASANTSEKPKDRLFAPIIIEMLNPKQSILKPQTFSIQMRFQSETMMRPVEKEQLVEKFKEARTIFANRLIGSSNAGKP